MTSIQLKQKIEAAIAEYDAITSPMTFFMSEEFYES